MDPLGDSGAPGSHGGFRWLETLLLLLVGGGLLLFLMRPQEAPDQSAATPEPTATPARTGHAVQPRPTVLAMASPTPALRLPGPPREHIPSPVLRQMLHDAEGNNQAVAWRSAGDRALTEKCYTSAAIAYRREAAVYRKTGDLNAAVFEETKAGLYETHAELFVTRAATQEDRIALNTHARLEPAVGCLLGAFIDRDDALTTHLFGNQTHGDIEQFEKMSGRALASVFMYRAYGEPFPDTWVEYVRSQGLIPHIAWEPDDLSKVRDDAYLQDWVRRAAAAKCPIFLRFAGEMNGDWTPYHKDPAAYRKAFRTVAEAFHRGAPQVALIWCPNAIPRENLEPYYPGDDAIDWVGVNFYSVLFEDDNPQRPADAIHPTSYLDYVYQKYSSRKPIAIAEYAASHLARVDPRPRPDFAIQKMTELFAALPARYPRVKMVDWYDCNNLLHAMPGRQLNNYRLTDDPAILQAWKEAISNDWYLDTTPHDPHLTVLLHDGQYFRGPTVVADVTTYTPHPQLYLELDGRIVASSTRPQDRVLHLPLLLAGPHRLRLLIYDENGQFITAIERRVMG